MRRRFKVVAASLRKTLLSFGCTRRCVWRARHDAMRPLRVTSVSCLHCRRCQSACIVLNGMLYLPASLAKM